MSLVVPAVLPRSREELEKKLAFFASLPSVNRVQIDVVDGRVAPAASWPYTAPEEFNTMVMHGETLPSLTRIAYEVDLMCFDALTAAEAWLALGATRLTFHAETSPDLPRFLASVRERYGSLLSIGLALNVAADLSLVRPCLDTIAYVQFMGIAHIGKQGQPFDERVFKKIETFRMLYPAMPFQIDGGVSLENAGKLVALGARNLVVGSAILRAGNPSAVVARLEALRTPFGV